MSTDIVQAVPEEKKGDLGDFVEDFRDEYGRLMPGHHHGRPKGIPNKDKREQIELLKTLRDIITDNVEGLATSFPQLIADKPAEAWKIAITLCPKEMTHEIKGLELPPIVVALQSLRETMKGLPNGNN